MTSQISVSGTVEPQPNVLVRAARHEDVPRLMELIHAHAEFERAHINLEGLQQRLASMIIQPADSAACIVAEVIRVGGIRAGSIAGYATMSPEFSTWGARHYLHMDTLFVDESSRGYGIGNLLIDQVVAIASERGYLEVQWQTPDWNADAIRFYERLGAVATPKQRFRLATPEPRPPNSSRGAGSVHNGLDPPRSTSVAACLHPDATYQPSVGVDGAPFIGVEAVLSGINRMWHHDDGSTAEFGPLLETGTSITRTWTYHFPDHSLQHGIDIFTFAGGKIISKGAYRRQIATPVIPEVA
jgi:ribosomal protein S18 acetylase RimI-like enzyme